MGRTIAEATLFPGSRLQAPLFQLCLEAVEIVLELLLEADSVDQPVPLLVPGAGCVLGKGGKL